MIGIAEHWKSGNICYSGSIPACSGRFEQFQSEQKVVKYIKITLMWHKIKFEICRHGHQHEIWQQLY